jgi:hypothetical protein
MLHESGGRTWHRSAARGQHALIGVECQERQIPTDKCSWGGQACYKDRCRGQTGLAIGALKEMFLVMATREVQQR